MLKFEVHHVISFPKFAAQIFIPIKCHTSCYWFISSFSLITSDIPWAVYYVALWNHVRSSCWLSFGVPSNTLPLRETLWDICEGLYASHPICQVRKGFHKSKRQIAQIEESKQSLQKLKRVGAGRMQRRSTWAVFPLHFTVKGTQIWDVWLVLHNVISANFSAGTVKCNRADRTNVLVYETDIYELMLCLITLWKGSTLKCWKSVWSTE